MLQLTSITAGRNPCRHTCFLRFTMASQRLLPLASTPFTVQMAGRYSRVQKVCSSQLLKSKCGISVKLNSVRCSRVAAKVDRDNKEALTTAKSLTTCNITFPPLGYRL